MSHKLDEILKRMVVGITALNHNVIEFKLSKKDVVSEAKSAIIEYLLGLLPEKRNPFKDNAAYNCRECGDEGWCEGYNACLDEIKRRIKEEK